MMENMPCTYNENKNDMHDLVLLQKSPEKDFVCWWCTWLLTWNVLQVMTLQQLQQDGCEFAILVGDLVN